jgi:YidC/Oxa1 family membrane protein insertase
VVEEPKNPQRDQPVNKNRAKKKKKQGKKK